MFRILTSVLVAATLMLTAATANATGGVLVPQALYQFDPFNPYPSAVVAERVRMHVRVLAELGRCSTIWTVVDCPRIEMMDGTLRPVMLSNYTHRGTRYIQVERITYDFSQVYIADAPSIVFVTVTD